MKILLVEDEKPAREHLERLLLEAVPSAQILARLESVRQAVDWLRMNSPDLIFLDIHLADDLSFRIFEQVRVTAPVIFTTAYDQYALRAFKVNSIDYLLKPFSKSELSAALDKFRHLHTPVVPPDFQALISALTQPKPVHQERFLVSKGERVMSVTIDQVAYFEGEDRYVFLTKKDGKRFIVDYKLSDLELLLDPRQFFRLNRSFIAHFSSIREMLNMSKSRVKVTLEPAAGREIMVSSEQTQAFKVWLNQ